MVTKLLRVGLKSYSLWGQEELSQFCIGVFVFVCERASACVCVALDLGILFFRRIKGVVSVCCCGRSGGGGNGEVGELKVTWSPGTPWSAFEF